MPTVGANLVFALLPAVSLPGDHKDRPYRGLIQLKIALVCIAKCRGSDSSDLQPGLINQAPTNSEQNLQR